MDEYRVVGVATSRNLSFGLFSKATASDCWPAGRTRLERDADRSRERTVAASYERDADGSWLTCLPRTAPSAHGGAFGGRVRTHLRCEMTRPDSAFVLLIVDWSGAFVRRSSTHLSFRSTFEWSRDLFFRVFTGTVSAKSYELSLLCVALYACTVVWVSARRCSALEYCIRTCGVPQ
jgi:hypothetical protein